jgi:hypothetical protein
MGTTRFIACLALLFIVATGTAQGQQVVDEAHLNAAVVDRADAAEQDRQQLRSLLQRDDVRHLVAERGVDMDRLDDAIGTLNAADLERIAPLVQQVNGELVGGQAIRLSAATIIVILLLVIAIILIS